ncbi:unnamed protein product [Zymoseptoria tritici ST99CH_1A5]|uniref:Uncharacterized protein n=2 Tax=Zymoseptoria tritici TaxID=1047171 RepID=A0A2H1GH59_ZYMTR|nr:unnamed protein product [Zymoseptoria tritici ST99CH_1E4]SMR54284.1 unnamed protein product [Zymoseptoria tritici ST99CH_3D1]SMY24622.1 unnamed protein product [Zymoseptoria tritici ST99CH_1A5]
MPPGQTIPSNLSWAVAKKVCTQQDMERLACAYLNATEAVNFNADQAAKDFGGGKAESFKRGIWVITKKIKDYKDAGEGEGEQNDPTDSAVDAPSGKGKAKAKSKPGRKRKAAAENAGAGEGEGEAPKTKKRGGSEKTATPEVSSEVKAEPGNDDDEGMLT